jgi:hypothetical protein
MRRCRNKHGCGEKENSPVLECLVIATGLIALLLGAGNGYGGELRPAAEPHVTLAPLQTYVEPGELCTLQVWVDDAVDSISCYEIFVSFDTMLVSCTDAEEGQLYKDATDPTFFDWDLVSSDTVTAVDCVLGYRTFVLAPGELLTLVFSALSCGICDVVITKVRLWDIDRLELAPTIGQAGVIVIGNASGEEPVMPGSLGLFNYPNPFNPVTNLVLDIDSPEGSPEVREVSISIYEPTGIKVRSLYRGRLPGGRNELLWDGRNDLGTIVAAGVYFAIAKVEGNISKRKLVMLR